MQVLVPGHIGLRNAGIWPKLAGSGREQIVCCGGRSRTTVTLQIMSVFLSVNRSTRLAMPSLIPDRAFRPTQRSFLGEIEASYSSTDEDFSKDDDESRK